MGKCCFHVKFVQTDRRTTVKQYAADLSMQGHKNKILALPILKTFAEDKSNVTGNIEPFFQIVENIV